MLSYAGYAAAELTPRLRSIVERWWDREAIDLWTWPGFQAQEAGHLPFPSQPEVVKPKLNTLYWPSGASRWGVFHGLWGASAVTGILGSTGVNAPVPEVLHLEDDSSTVALTPSMHLIAVRPVFIRGAADENLYWLTLVCPRYFWWTRPLEYNFSPGDTWATLLTNLVSFASGLTPTVPTIPAGYGSPAPTRWTNPECPLPPLIDAAAWTVGLRFLYNLDGTASYQTADDAATADDARWSQNRSSLAQGGRLAIEDLSGNVPESVTVGFWGDTPNTYAVSLASLALPAYGSISGVVDARGWVQGDRYAEQTSPTAASYATQAATDYYGWMLTRTDGVFRGIRNAAVTGLDDRVEWEYTPAIPIEEGFDAGDVLNQRLPDVRVCTRIVPFPWGDRNVYGRRSPAGYAYPVRITAGPSSGAYKAVVRTLATGSVADGPQVGFGADVYNVYATTGTPAVGDYGTAVPDPLVPGKWLFTPPPPPVPYSGGCGWLAGIPTTTCFEGSVVSTSGLCDCGVTIPTPPLILTWDAGLGGWAGGDIDVCGVLMTALLTVAGCAVPCLALTDPDENSYSLHFNGCGDGYVDFAGGGPALCDGTPAEDPCGDNTFRLRLTCIMCPNPDYDGPGWYCSSLTGCDGADTPTCTYYATDPGPGVYLCNGPHATEADCITPCDAIPPCGCLATVGYPDLAVSGDGTGTLVWDGTRWGGLVTLAGPCDIYVCVTLNEDTGTCLGTCEDYAVTFRCSACGGGPDVTACADQNDTCACDPFALNVSCSSLTSVCCGSFTPFDITITL